MRVPCPIPAHLMWLIKEAWAALLSPQSRSLLSSAWELVLNMELDIFTAGQAYCLIPSAWGTAILSPVVRNLLKIFELFFVMFLFPCVLPSTLQPCDTFGLNKTSVFSSSQEIMFFQLWSFLFFSQVSSHGSSSVVLKAQLCTLAEAFLHWVE